MYSVKNRLLVTLSYGNSLKTWDGRGILNRELALYRLLATKGMEVTFLSYGDEVDFELVKRDSRLHVILLPCVRWSKIISILRQMIFCCSFKRKFGYFDIIKTNQLMGSWLALIVGKLSGSPVLVRCGFDRYDFAIRDHEGRLKSALIYFLSRLSFGWAARIHVASDRHRLAVINNWNVESSKIFLVPNFIDIKAFKPNPNMASTRDFIFMGRLEDQKRPLLFLESLVAFRSLSGLEPLATVVGDGSLLNVCREFVEHNELLHVTFIQSVPNEDVPILFRDHRAFIMTSGFEGNPKTLIEAMACGVHTLALNAPGVTEVIRTAAGETWIFDDVAGLAVGMLELLSAGVASNDAPASSLLYVEKNHSLTTIAAKELQAYQSMLENRN